MRKIILIGAGVLVGIALLAGAAYLGARLLAGGPGEGPLAGAPVLQGGGGASATGFAIKIEPAEEIPVRTAELSGLIQESRDNSLMVGEVSDVEGVSASSGEEGGASGLPTPEVSTITEVVVSQETKIYNDTTFAGVDTGEMAEKNAQTLQQTVERIGFSDLRPETMVRVWGYKRGDRLVAEVIVTSQPVTYQNRQ